MKVLNDVALLFIGPWLLMDVLPDVLSKLDKIWMCWDTVRLCSADDWCIVCQVGLGLKKPPLHPLSAKSMPALNLVWDCACFSLMAFLLF